MAIGDLLWACPVCGEAGGIRRRGRGEACVGCGATFVRTRGARIRVRDADGAVLERSAAEWVDALPAPDADTGASAEEGAGGRAPSAAGADGFLLRDRADVRQAGERRPLRRHGEYVGRVERPGKWRRGWLELYPDRLVFHGDDGAGWTVLLLDVAALGSSSSSLQLRPRGAAVLAIRPRGSLRRWEELLTERIRVAFRRAGRGEIVELVPRVTTAR